MSVLENLLSQYPILINAASFISTLDLYHLALTNKAFHTLIFRSQCSFDVLKRQCICDGHGLKDRQDFVGPYNLLDRNYTWADARHIWQDEPIEVRVYATKCAVSDTLPCRKCDINVCDECRYYPRERTNANHFIRRPHLNSSWMSFNVMCLCPSCDSTLETELQGNFLNELCDCDSYKRWVCNKCRRDELRFTSTYYREHTALDNEAHDDDGMFETKAMSDHGDILLFYCICGALVPEETRPRCTWCQRRHLPEDQWAQEWDALKLGVSVVDEDPCYPPFIGDIYADSCDKPYPKLAYDGPIWQASKDSTS